MKCLDKLKDIYKFKCNLMEPSIISILVIIKPLIIIVVVLNM